MHSDRSARLKDFSGWASRHIKGDEKGEAQIFLDRLFIAFGRSGSLDVGGTPELRIRKAREDGGGTSFADYVWKPVVLIEMKKRGTDLSKHFRQAFDYWTRLVPGRPQYVVLCNFDEFWVYDFNTQIDDPKDKLRLADLPSRYGPLAFLFPTNERPVFENDREEVTRQAADFLAECFRKLTLRKVDRDLAQRFILQTLMALFAEDIGLLPKYTVIRLLDEIKQPGDAYDLLGGLFTEMNTPGVTPGGRFKGTPYFNGGLFRHPARLPELYEDELNQLKGAAIKDWSKVSPEIFGELFQKSMDAEERHAFGAHFTFPSDIMKIVKPTITDPWTDAIESAKSAKKLLDLLERLTTLRVLDPACGSGNFLYLAYREMKRLESRIRERLTTEFPAEQPRLIHVNARQFFGLDINPFAIELAKVTMLIGRKLAIDELHIADEPALPLDNLDDNFQARDALIDELGNRASWPPAEVIIGNPPFLGAAHVVPLHGERYAKRLRMVYDGVPGTADFCVHWIRRAQDHLPLCTADAPLVGRAGLVGTQNIRNGQSRVGGLDHVVEHGVITEAVDNQPWSGEAAVHVSIVNWAKTGKPSDANFLPEKRRLWFKSKTKRSSRTPNDVPSVEPYELEYRDVSAINSSLSAGTDVSDAETIAANHEPQRVFRGQEPGNRGFVLTPSAADAMIRKDPNSAEVIFPHLIGRDLLTGDGKPRRFIIDFGARDQLKAAAFPGAFAHLQKEVLGEMEEIASAEEPQEVPRHGNKRRKARIARWWLHRRACVDTVSAIEALPRYIACSRHLKRNIFEFMDPRIRPDSAVQVFAFADDYSFGILQSSTHWLWFTTKCGKLTERFRYSVDFVFGTFPWPQSPTKKQIDTVASAAVELRRVRADALTKIKGGLRALYRTLELPGRNPLKDAHAALDSAVLAAYGFDPKSDLLAQLLHLNQLVASRERASHPVTAPGVPPSYGDPSPLITPDCIRP